MKSRIMSEFKSQFLIFVLLLLSVMVLLIFKVNNSGKNSPVIDTSNAGGYITDTSYGSWMKIL